jgi:HEAT repeat protein
LSVPLTKRIVSVGLLTLLFAGNVVAQTGPVKPAPASEATAIARGWALLADGRAAQASQLAADLLKQFPRSVAVATLFVDSEIARGGSAAGLAAYERWLERRTLEDGYLLRRVSRSVLRNLLRDTNPAVRADAAAALKDDGDRAAADAVPAPVPESVETLLARMEQPGPARPRAVAELGRSRDPRAVPALVAALGDDDMIVRAAAAEALGTLDATESISRLHALLADPALSVQLAAAKALQALNDRRGAEWLRKLASSEHAAIRLEGVRALKNEAGPEWEATVRALTADANPAVRRSAAELIAPFDPALAEATLKTLLDDPNPAIRQVARTSFISSVATDLTTLRGFLRHEDAFARLGAAARILQLTR